MRTHRSAVASPVVATPAQDGAAQGRVGAGHGNQAAQDRLPSAQTGGAGAGGLDAWGTAVAEDGAALAPYAIEVAEGQVAEPGQHDGVVEWMQAALGALGYAAPQTRIFDGPTVAALQEWQRLNKAPVTGVFGPEELALMRRAMEASISLVEFQENAPGIPEATLREYLPHLNAAMLAANITSDTRKAVFIAQLGHESDGFNTLEEYASGANYEGREDLGNVHPGDGRRFKGRGPIQITGRDNYQSYGNAIGVDLIADPEVAATPEVGFQLAAEYWTRNNLNRYADRGQFDTVTERINGGQNGRPDRRNRWARAKRVAARWSQTPDVVPRPRERPDDLGQGPAPTGEAGQLDGVFTLLAAGDHAGAMAAAQDAAAAAQEAGAELGPASRARDVARFLLDAQEAAAAGEHDAAKTAAHDAAQQARWLRDNGMVGGNFSDPVIAMAGRIWTEANTAARAQGNQADVALVAAALPLRRGDQGPAVAALQRLLGMDVGGGAGSFGPATERAVRAFQQGKGLGVDGVVGGGTLEALGG